MLFAGTRATAGSGTAIVIGTGPRTELGRIARLLGEAETGPAPLQRRLADLGQALALACLLLGALVFSGGRLQHQPAATLLLAAVGLAVATIPEGLPAAVTMAMKAGVRRLARCKVLVRSLPAVETLGAISVVATDKTGTLTQNEMTVRELVLEGSPLEVTGTGYTPKGAILRERRPADPTQWESLGVALRICALCSSARLAQAEGSWQVVGDPTEGALLTLAAKGGIWQDDARRAHPALAVFPFTAERRLMTVVVPARGGRPMALTKGAPDVVLARCLHHRTSAGVRPLSPADRERILAQGEEMAGRALRVLGLAYREDAAGKDGRAVERSMVWVGLVGMFDPPRPDVPAAFAACRAAGIIPVIITGDQKLTALALAREIGALRPGGEAISGEELDRLTPEALGACVERYRVYARVTAEHKLRIIRAWRRRGHLVAMNGDGLNDAPALKEADIGIAMGRTGTDVTREAAALVLADDSFASIVAAVAAARGIGENVRRFAAYLLSCSVGGALALAAGALAGLPLPLLPLQLLWVNILAAGPPALALAQERHDPAVMREPPPGPREGLLGKEGWVRLLVEGAAIAAAALAAFLLVWRGGAGGEARARTAAFAVLAMATIAHAFGARRRRRSLFLVNPLTNLRLFAAAGLSGLLLAAVVQIPLLGGVLGTVPLAREEWLRAAALALLPLPAAEIYKAWLRAREED
jgi:Ca2+-transporting ATPase